MNPKTNEANAGENPHEPSRRVLRMVRELHRMGYQRLRIAPGVSPSGFYWRCIVAPVTSIQRSHGARLSEHIEGLAPYTSADGTTYFRWPDTSNDSPRQLAEKLVERFTGLAELGRGADKPYADWYDCMMRATAPAGLVYAYASWDMPEDRLLVLNHTNGSGIPLPPPGQGGGESPSCRRQGEGAS